MNVITFLKEHSLKKLSHLWMASGEIDQNRTGGYSVHWKDNCYTLLLSVYNFLDISTASFVIMYYNALHIFFHTTILHR